MALWRRAAGLFAVWGLGAAAVCGVAAPALSVEPDAPERIITRLDAVVLTVLSRLEARPKAGQNAFSRRDHNALVEFYAEPSRVPLWVDEGGLTRRGREALAELNAAADYGLDPRDYDIADVSRLTGDAASRDPAGRKGYASEGLGQAELKLSAAVLLYARHAQAGRVVPQAVNAALDLDPRGPEPYDVLATLARPDKSVSVILHSYHPRHPQFEALRRQLLAARGRSPGAGAEAAIPEGPALKTGDRHPHVALLRRRLGLGADHHDTDRYDEDLARAVRDFQRSAGLAPSGAVGLATRHALNRARGDAGQEGLIAALLINMERWRWEPRDFGDFHVWVNIPEFLVRVKKGGQTIHEERVVAGKLEHQTPVMSRHLEFIEFNPYWNVPPSIMVQEILPMLRRDPETLARHQLQVYWQGRPVESQTVDWSHVDPARISMKQPPGRGNVLGVVKFGFPNRHNVYMHDTPTRQLFDNTVRAESHGCMRVRNPLRLAEVLLSGQGWSAGRIRSVIEDGANQTVYLSRRIPIHLTYFTLWIDQRGRPATFRDVYGHDSRLRAALRL